MKIGLIGGTFDPIHKGHLAMAKAVLKLDGMNECWLIPAIVSPFKTLSQTSFTDRCRMIDLAIQPYRKIKCCQIESELPSPSYTIQTLRLLHQRYPMHQFTYYIGYDQAQQLVKWKEIEECMKLAEFKVFPRDKETIQCDYPLASIKMDLMPISSTQIRNGHLSLTLPKVRSYIFKQGLYLDEFVATQMSEKRFLHSKSVAKLSQEIARANGYDEHAAYLAGMLHDICKEWSDERSYIVMEHCFKNELTRHKNIWHSFIASQYIRQVYGYSHPVISQAIYHHTIGESSNPIAMILYIADKIEPLRGYDSSKEIALAKKDLKAAFQVVYQQQEQYLQGEKHGK